ncbi:hypothetical protein CBS101457_000398 [Exobasidium rhododendri]|nr:hypothetical protein CBS101457_000398 [Exobasidium rhododendri]
MLVVVAQLGNLPTEIVLLIFSHLNPPSLARCQRVCRKWNKLAKEDDVWRRIAIQHAYADESHRQASDVMRKCADDTLYLESATSKHCLLKELPEETLTSLRTRSRKNAHDFDSNLTDVSAFAMSSASDYYPRTIQSFQALCGGKWCLDEKWQCRTDAVQLGMHVNVKLGDSHSRPTQLTPEMRNLDAAPPYVGAGWNQNGGLIEEVGRDVWRIKIDPIAKVLISSGQRGGIRVVDISTGEVLWRLDRHMTRNFPHIEYDRGHLVFDRVGHGIEVWKTPYSILNPVGRGCFALHATLDSSHPTRAFRLQFPILAVATQDNLVLLWDILLETIVSEYSIQDTIHVDGNINYIDFDDDFIFLAGTGAKSVTIISRKLGVVIWTLADHFAADLEAPQTYALVDELPSVPGQYASLERRRLKRSGASPWQRASGQQNLAQRTMTPIQSWSAIHPDFRSRTLVILGQTNVLIIRDYLTCFLAWQRRKEQDLRGKAGTRESLAPDLFADLQFGVNKEGEADFAWDEIPTSQLAVAESRAMCIVGKPMLLDLDPLRLIRNDVRNIGAPKQRPSAQLGEIVSDEEAGFAVYNNVICSADNRYSDDARSSSLESCSCVMMDSTSAYAVQVHEAKTNMFDGGLTANNLAMTEYHDVLVWDFSQGLAPSRDEMT